MISSISKIFPKSRRKIGLPPLPPPDAHGPGFELSNMNWGVEKFLHGRMSRPEFFEPKNSIKS